MAWVIAGWKRPPWAECFSRWVGRTWPEVKKLEKNLRGGLVQLLWFGPTSGVGCDGLIREAYVVSA